MSKLVLVADEAAPSTPAAGQAIYTESGRLKRQSSGGTVRYLDAVSGAGVLTLATDTAITGGGTVALGGYTLTVPATGTAALLATANVYTAAQTINSPAAGTVALVVNSAASPTANIANYQVNGSTKTWIDKDAVFFPVQIASPLSYTLATNTGAGTATQALSVGAVRSALVLVYSSSAGVGAVFAVSDAGSTLLTGNSTYWKTAKDTTSGATVAANVYLESNTVYVQNARTTGGNAIKALVIVSL